MNSKLRQNHYFYLLIALLVQLIAYPFFDDAAGKGMAISVLSSLTIFAAIYAADVGKKQLFLALGLAGFAFCGIWYVVFIEPRYYLAMISVISQLAFNVYVIALILVGLFRTEKVTSNTIYGASSVYMLIGFSFAILYLFLESFWPGSFYIGAAHNLGGHLDFADFLYFSFSTLTTLGYGDITPIASLARATTSLQAIFGVLYVAILMSRFVGIYIAEYLKIESKS